MLKLRTSDLQTTQLILHILHTQQHQQPAVMIRNAEKGFTGRTALNPTPLGLVLFIYHNQV